MLLYYFHFLAHKSLTGASVAPAGKRCNHEKESAHFDEFTLIYKS
jgi:hypothetical protein